ncbi:MAG: TolC family protein [Candidatus Krumholzibacteriota bacterium]|nr:TolC family protein [Candidatus Krumholzibacteriota bacterium]
MENLKQPSGLSIHTRSQRVPLMLAILVAFPLISGPRPVPARAEKSAQEQVLSLDNAIERGLKHDELLRQAGEGVRGALAGLREARAARLPQLNISGQYGRNIQKPVFFLPPDFASSFGGGATKVEMGEDNEFLGTAQLTYNLWTAGRLTAGIKASDEMVEALRSQESSTRQLVGFQVKEAYYGVLLAAEGLKITSKAIEDIEELVRVSRAGFREGTVSKFDLLRAEVELENRRPQHIQAQNELEQALALLRRRCGIEPGAPISLSDSLRRVEDPEELDYLLARMRLLSPQLWALEHQVQALRQNINFEKAQRWPLLQLGANYSFQSQWSGDYLPGSRNMARFSSVTLGFQIPIFDGFRAKSRIDRARSELRSAEIERERLLREKELAVRTSLLQLENAISALQGRQYAVALAEEAYRLVQVRLKNGLATPLERLDAELAKTTARWQLAQVLYACNMARAGLELSVGENVCGDSAAAEKKESQHE